MIVRIDHAIVGVRSLRAATRLWTQQLGFALSPGGEHIDIGTHNALIRFPSDYLELIAVQDRSRAARDPIGARLSELIDAGEGLYSYAVVTDDIDSDVARMRAAGVSTSDPIALRRERPDGQIMHWRCAFPGNSPWDQTLPFLIEKPPEHPGPERPPEQPNGACGFARVHVRVASLDRAVEHYEKGLGLTAHTDDGIAVLDIGGAKIVLETGAPQGVFALALWSTADDGPLDATDARVTLVKR